MKSLILSCSLLLSLFATPAGESTPTYEGYGPATFTIPLAELGQATRLSYTLHTWFGYSRMSVSDQAGTELVKVQGWGLLLMEDDRSLDLSEVSGENLSVTIEGARTDFRFSFSPLHQ